MLAAQARQEVEAHYRNTLAYIRRKQQQDGTAEKFSSIQIS
jgi:hypothetical protein